MRYSGHTYYCGIPLLIYLTGFPVAAPEPPPAPGRYQLIPAAVTVLGLQQGQPSSLLQSNLYRLDTATGQTWVLLTLNVDGKTSREWLPIPPPAK